MTDLDLSENIYEKFWFFGLVIIQLAPVPSAQVLAMERSRQPLVEETSTAPRSTMAGTVVEIRWATVATERGRSAVVFNGLVMTIQVTRDSIAAPEPYNSNHFEVPFSGLLSGSAMNHTTRLFSNCPEEIEHKSSLRQ